jgi:hypothetical protein
MGRTRTVGTLCYVNITYHDFKPVHIISKGMGTNELPSIFNDLSRRATEASLYSLHVCIPAVDCSHCSPRLRLSV